MCTLISLVLFDTFFIDNGTSRLTHPSLVLAHVVKLRGTHREVWLGVAITLEDLPRQFLVLLHLSNLFIALISATDLVFLICGLWHFKVLLRQVRLAKLIYKLKSTILSLGIISTCVILVVVPVLGHPFKGRRA